MGSNSSDSLSYLCPRLVDYLAIVGGRNPARNSPAAQTPELLRRYPPQDHTDLALPPDVVYFCQPEGCINTSQHRLCQQETTPFMFTLTEKDSGRVRYGVCLNFFRPIERRGLILRHQSHAESLPDSVSTSGSEVQLDFSGTTTTSKPPAHVVGPAGSDTSSAVSGTSMNVSGSLGRSKMHSHTLTSFCLISHHPFFSKFRECLLILKKMIDACYEKSGKDSLRKGPKSSRESVWAALTGAISELTQPKVLSDTRVIETWILRLLSAPVPVPGRTRVQLTVVPSSTFETITFSLPDKTRLSLVDFALHMPLELLGVEMCVKVLSLIMLEQKVLIQSRNYNALTMTVMSLTAMLYPLQYMFPVIPLLPTCMSDAEQLLLAPTPYIIGIPSSFLSYRKNFKLPKDIWLVDLDKNELYPSEFSDPLPPLPEPEGKELKEHLESALKSMSTVCVSGQKATTLVTQTNEYENVYYGNDPDAVDIATRVAMVCFFNSPNVLGNFAEHTRTLRLYPRPVVAFQYYTFIKSRKQASFFTETLAKTQAVEYFAEWLLRPENEVFQRIHQGVFDPVLIGDKAKWFAKSLQCYYFRVCGETVYFKLSSNNTDDAAGSDVPSDSSGDSIEDGKSSCSTESSYSDCILDIIDSGIAGEMPEIRGECQLLFPELASVYEPPTELQLLSTSGSSLSPYVTMDSEEYEPNNKSPDLSNRPARPPPPTRVGSVGSHPGTPKNAPKVVVARSTTPDPEMFQRMAAKGSTRSGQSSPRHAIPSNMTGSGESGFLSHDGSGMSVLTSFTDNMATQATNAVSGFLSPRRSVIERSELLKNLESRSGSLSPGRLLHISPEQARINAQNSQNQIFLKEVVGMVSEGKTMWFPSKSRLRKLMEDENYRNFAVSLLAKLFGNQLYEKTPYIQDVPVHTKASYNALVNMLRIIAAGLEQSCTARGHGGLSSAFMLLEIAHTHFFVPDGSVHLSDSSLAKMSVNPVIKNNSPFGSQESIARRADDGTKLVATVTGWWKDVTRDLRATAVSEPLTSPLHRYLAQGKPLVVNGEEYENIEVTQATPTETSQNAATGKAETESGGISPSVVSPSESLVPPSSTVSTPSRTLVSRGKSRVSRGWRYTGKLTEVSTEETSPRVYVFEGMVTKDRAKIWDNLQFWEDAFFDAVAQERDIVGMDQGPTEMLDRYSGLRPSERKRLELDEDRLLSVILYNMIAFMVMMRVDKVEIRRKVRRMLAKSHLGLTYSQEVNHILDSLQNLHGNDIDLKPIVSRLMQKQSFAVHLGEDNTGDMFFLEVCEDCLILRSVSGAIVDRWWYEKLLNMTYSGRTKVLRLWMREDNQSQLYSFYTRKCKYLYMAIETSMKQAATKNNRPPQSNVLGGRFPVENARTGEAGFFVITLDGVEIQFKDSVLSIELSRIKRCFPQKTGLFVIEELDLSSREVKLRKFKSSHPEDLSQALHRIFSMHTTQATDDALTASVTSKSVLTPPPSPTSFMSDVVVDTSSPFATITNQESPKDSS